PALTIALNRGDNYARQEAVTALCAVGPAGQVVAAGALKTKDLTFRRHILSSLKEARCRAKETVPLIAACLEYDSAPLRSLAAEVLGAMGPDADAALRALDDVLDDSDATVRASAAAAIKRIKA